MSHTYTVNNTTANTGTITLNTGAGVGGFGGAGTGLSNMGASTITLSPTSGQGFAAGQIYTTTGTGSANWVTPSNPIDTVMKVNQTNPPTIEVKGNMVINGRDLEELLNTIEKVLQIPERDVKLEKKHPKLKKLYDDYINALGKYRTFEAIKGDE
jgi:hypothetical protein